MMVGKLGSKTINGSVLFALIAFLFAAIPARQAEAQNSPPAVPSEMAEPTAAADVPVSTEAAPSVPIDAVKAAGAASPSPAAASSAEVSANSQGEPLRPASLPRDLSPWGMFLAADRVVKAVMLGLAFASVVTWTIWLLKGAEIAGARLGVRNAGEALAPARNLAEAAVALSRRRGATALLAAAALQETHLSADIAERGRIGGIKERIEARLARIEVAAGRRLARGTGILASIGATAPFVGLFGTVWGIMNAFIGISEAETTNLAVVAPGIAEALLATACGLIAAIPAVVIYNLFARAIAGYRAALADASAEVMRLASRDLDRQLAATGYRAAAE